ncbi:TetR/AcrR family transcriptional regulator [Halobacillus shinanisalinarum]|uniref:TetR/AcrR family transcriptional regulator n=1 Tax=Halobacillus shinanisalinarum TaxID=2932258 RepID=A0ABY4H4X2_9BACI|nr:TetR/AcrR family transcriptional regulator [Halobacillus shinanisalinarum]UOQ94622.1 TetR/AcrR family transcriptional regulator [Halobacillus shinanisalinarum]
MRQKIIDKSIGLFDRKGFTETSIQDIVDELEVTKGTFYYYFKSKQELLRDIHLGFIEYLLKHQAVIINDDSKDSRTKLHDAIYMIIHSIKHRKQSARIFFREMRNLGPEYLEQNVEKRDQFRRNLQSLIEEGISKGEFQSDLNSDMITRGILGVTNWSYYWFNPEGDVSDEELASIYLEMILNGINKKD